MSEGSGEVIVVILGFPCFLEEGAVGGGVGGGGGRAWEAST